MIATAKSRLLTRWFAWDSERRIKRSFDAVRVHGLDSLRRSLARRSVLVVSNHTAWWDPLVALVVSSRLVRSDAYAMMDAKNLERFPFFGRIGAFGVDLTDPRDGARAIRFAAELLAGERRLVWIFAQGREVPVTVRPLGLRQGAAVVARIASSSAVLPCALRYEMGGTPKPSLWVSFGEPLRQDTGDFRRADAQERAIEQELDRIEASIAGGPKGGEAAGFETLHVARPSRWLALATAALGRVSRLGS